MRLIKRSLLLPLLLLLLFLPSGRAYAEERSIYVGDLINIKITSPNITEQELREKFADFEVVDLKQENDGYIITVRSFEVGEKTIQVGNEELKITVKSTLDDIGHIDVFSGDMGTKPAGFSIAWQYVLYTLILIFIVTGGFTAKGFIRRRKLAALTPYQRFIGQLENTQLTGDSCFVLFTRSLKQYLEAIYSCSIKGKTSSEIMEELKLIPELQEALKPLSSWLEECDYYKFTRAAATIEHKQKLSGALKALVMDMENKRGAEACSD